MKRISDWIALLAFILVAIGATMLWPLREGVAQQKLLEVGRKSEQVYALYRKADYQTAKTALLDHVKYLDHLNSEAPRPIAHPAAVDAMIFTIRLAKLEEKHGGTDKAKYMQDAMARCAKPQHWQKCSEHSLRQKVDEIDQ